MFTNQIIELMERRRKAMSFDDIASFLRVEDREELSSTLEQMLQDGKIRQTKKEKYLLLSQDGCYVGEIHLTERGFGFFMFEDRTKRDVFIHQKNLNGAMNGDKVLVCITKPEIGEEHAEGYVEKVIEHRTTKVVGKVDIGNNVAFVVSLDRKVKQDIFIPLHALKHAKQDDIVEVEITKYARGGKNPEGIITKIIGQTGAPFVDIDTALAKFELPDEFPPEVLEYANTLSRTISEEERKRRRDLTAEVTVTIDGIDAKDFDDAISIEPHEKGYKLGVHIADVTHYVQENDPIDIEAFKRGTSIYFPGMVISMLPEILSNDLCSLRPGEDSLTLSVEMIIDHSGKVLESDIFESIIQSKKRLVYDDVSDFLEGKNELFNGELKDDIILYKELADLLNEKRITRGAVDFGFVESEILTDDNGKVVDIKKRDRRIANRMIEEFMILTNEVVSEHFFHLETPFLYRTHEKPSLEKLTEFNQTIYNFGFKLNGKLDDIEPSRLNELIQKVKDTPYSHIVNKLMLRSLKQAKYTNYMEGHFGLASKYYSHFTAPIRRYPDLQIHRIIKEQISGKLDRERTGHYEEILEMVAEHSSKRERIAEEAERDIDDIKMAEYMEDKIGEVYQSTISSVTSFGIFVELDNTVEGMIRLNELKNDFYQFDKETLSLRGTRTNTIYSIGQAMTVKLVSVNVEQGEINFVPYEERHE